VSRSWRTVGKRRSAYPLRPCRPLVSVVGDSSGPQLALSALDFLSKRIQQPKTAFSLAHRLQMFAEARDSFFGRGLDRRHCTHETFLLTNWRRRRIICSVPEGGDAV